MGCAGPKASPIQQVSAALKAGFKDPNALITIVAISQAESCGGQVYSTNEQGTKGNLQFMPANQNIAGCNLMDSDPQKALECNFKSAYVLSNGGKDFCPWATYASDKCPENGTTRIATYKQFTEPSRQALSTYNAQSLEQRTQNTLTGSGNPAGQVAGGVLADIGHATGLDVISNVIDKVQGILTSKSGWARIALFALGIFIAFEAVKHFAGSDSNLIVSGAKTAGKAALA